jgi:hypothetical protein
MAESSTIACVHPLVVMSLADHSTRTSVQKSSSQAFGVLLGQVNSLSGECQFLETFEMLVENKRPDIKNMETDLKICTYELIMYISIHTPEHCDVQFPKHITKDQVKKINTFKRV